jgi:CoA:oxalate CoA-transferase
MSTPNPPGGRPLDGVRILDFTRVLSGPYATALLADLGAEVIKVEGPGGDDYRHIGPFLDDGSSAIFEAVNRGKRGVVLDLADPRQRATAVALAREADVVVENFRPGVADRLGIGWSALSAENPRLIHASISGFGQEGPESRRPAYDIVVQALSGLMQVTGDPAGDPTLIGESIADVVSGLFTALGIVAALVERGASGRGRRIDVSMFDGLMAVQPLVVARCLATGTAPMRVGNRHPLSAPFGAYRAADGTFVVAVLNEKLFAALCGVMERADLAADPRFASDPDRLAHEPLLRAAIEAWAGRFSAHEAVARLVAAGVPAAEVADTLEALASAEARGRPVTQTVARDDGRALTVPEQPIHFAGALRAVSRPSPRLGEHDDLLADPTTAWSSRR